jgi:hypothetical protein
MKGVVTDVAVSTLRDASLRAAPQGEEIRNGPHAEEASTGPARGRPEDRLRAVSQHGRVTP